LGWREEKGERREAFEDLGLRERRIKFWEG